MVLLFTGRKKLRRFHYDIEKRKQEVRKISRKQIEKDFAQLYIGQNQKILVEEYYKKKKKDFAVLVFAGIALVLFLFVQQIQSSKLEQGTIVSRNEYGKGKKEVQLEVKTKEGEWQEFSFSLQEKQYTEEEILSCFEELEQLLPELILGENESLEKVVTSLNLLQEPEGYPVYLSWKSSQSEYLEHTGKRTEKQLPEESLLIELTVTMEYEEWSREHSFFIQLIRKEEQPQDSFWNLLRETVLQLETTGREEQELVLPKSYHSKELEWRYKKNGTVYLLGFLLLCLLPIIWREKDREIRKLAEEREQLLLYQYPEFISKLILLMEAGMNTKTAFFQIAEDYQRKKQKGKKSEYLYEELLYICRQLQNGMSEKESYELLGKRCELPVYRKLSALLVQNLQKGSREMMDILRQESKRANEERKQQMKKIGEETGTKLLFPMMIMLGIVMILIIVPACFSFQI